MRARRVHVGARRERRRPCQGGLGLGPARAAPGAETAVRGHPVSAGRAWHVLAAARPARDEGPRAPVDETVKLVQAGPRGRYPDKLLQGSRLAVVALAQELLGDASVQRLLEPEPIAALQTRGERPEGEHLLEDGARAGHVIPAGHDDQVPQADDIGMQSAQEVRVADGVFAHRLLDHVPRVDPPLDQVLRIGHRLGHLALAPAGPRVAGAQRDDERPPPARRPRGVRDNGVVQLLRAYQSCLHPGRGQPLPVQAAAGHDHGVDLLVVRVRVQERRLAVAEGPRRRHGAWLLGLAEPKDAPAALVVPLRQLHRAQQQQRQAPQDA
mmetsp:Transcript_96752/g.262879  ORF Transcript_96752/g.262879 Transcript_96752/m.262879 type:complete len:325 (+) Transcript_96752:246-1220(+)